MKLNTLISFYSGFLRKDSSICIMKWMRKISVTDLKLCPSDFVALEHDVSYDIKNAVASNAVGFLDWEDVT